MKKIIKEYIVSEMDNNNDLDDAWIEDFKNIEKKYDKYYKSIPRKITCYIIFINKEKEVSHLLANTELLDDNGFFSKERLIALINKYKKNKQYKFSKLLKYNITVDPIDISTINNGLYMTHINTIQNIKYNETIQMLQSINSLFVLYQETEYFCHDKSKKTKRRSRKHINKTRKMPCKLKHT